MLNINRNFRFENNFRIKEFIGLNVEIIESTNKNNVGLKGKVIDESYHMIIISSEKKIKKIPKKTSIFKFKQKKRLENKIKGSTIVGRPEDRIKKFLKKNRI